MIKPMALETTEGIQYELDTPRRFLQAVKEIEPGTAFTADDLADVTESMPTPQSRGSLFATREFRALAKSAGYAVKSTRTTGYVTAWERLEDSEVAA